LKNARFAGIHIQTITTFFHWPLESLQRLSIWLVLAVKRAAVARSIRTNKLS